MHLYRNMWKDFKGVGLRTLLWKEARSTTDYWFNKNMLELKNMSSRCYDWLISKPKSQWNRCAFRTNYMSDMFVNNHCEVFNNSIKPYRDMPIISMLKAIHIRVMTRIQLRRDKMIRWETVLCSNAVKKLNKAVVEVAGVVPVWSDGDRF